MRHRIPRRLLRRQLVPLRIRPYGAFFPPNAAPQKEPTKGRSTSWQGKKCGGGAHPCAARRALRATWPLGLSPPPPAAARPACPLTRPDRPQSKGSAARCGGGISSPPAWIHCGGWCGRLLETGAAAKGRSLRRIAALHHLKRHVFGRPVPMGPIGHSPAGKGMEEKPGDLWKSMWKTTGFVDIFRMTHKILVTTAGHQYRR